MEINKSLAKYWDGANVLQHCCIRAIRETVEKSVRRLVVVKVMITKGKEDRKLRSSRAIKVACPCACPIPTMQPLQPPNLVSAVARDSRDCGRHGSPFQFGACTSNPGMPIHTGDGRAGTWKRKQQSLIKSKRLSSHPGIPVVRILDPARPWVLSVLIRLVKA